MLERNFEGFNLVEITKDIWRLETIGGRDFNGTFLEVVLYAIIKLGFNINEIDTAVKTMLQENHNAAHFGMWARFMFSFNSIKELQRRAS